MQEINNTKNFLILLIFTLIVLSTGLILKNTGYLTTSIFSAPIEIPIPDEILDLTENNDFNNNGITNQQDILEGAKNRIGITTSYNGEYFSGGYPPDDTGVCTDVIWRSFENAGYDLKNLLDTDIKNNIEDYPRIEDEPDPNIDFRRVPNLISFFEKFAQSLTITITPNDIENLQQWQGGDIVTYARNPATGLMHIGIVSDKRRRDGVPYLIHNYGHGTVEDNMLTLWPTEIIGHYRFPKTNNQ